MTPIVVKLGGSMAYHAEMRKWVSVLAASGRPLVIVPGGGPFANRVREAQREMGFSNKAAHFMAILAMDQMGLAVVEMNERLTPVRSLEEIESALEDKKLPVWLPYRQCSTASDIPQSWDMTSDSLAAWLAGRLGAEALLLIKQTEAFEEVDDIETLVVAEIIDPLLPVMLGEAALYLAGPVWLEAAGECFAAGQVPGKRFSARAASQRGAA
ncbi:dihydroneopterin aldolase [Pseudaminobacter soli (ex Li et al. 2025)]|uniref:Dihydroneopterin aldolase n=1 Tax=Pseudaminobacter soli (ex Li et al. 2025) TaxID=1295366 RepID=A0A2P7S6Y4_9HYPH|nr:dihydroneopterin aldolase [Mesorhizobium soli]PSJ58200.1 dihydroneopterin aldolase [Mesorhizobium soli]